TAQVQVTPVSAGGGSSMTVAPVTGLGPAFLTTIPYVRGSPGNAAVWPSDLLRDRSATSPAVTVALPESLPGFGSFTSPAVLVAVFVRSPTWVTSAVSDSTARCVGAMSPT